MLSGENQRGAQPQVDAEPPYVDAIAADEGEELVPASRVAELVAMAEKRGRDSAWAAARRQFEKLLADKVAALEANWQAERRELIADVARATAARLKGTDDGSHR